MSRHLTPPTTVKYHAPKAVEKGETWITNKIQEEARPSDRSLFRRSGESAPGEGGWALLYKRTDVLVGILKKETLEVPILKQVQYTTH